MASERASGYNNGVMVRSTWEAVATRDRSADGRFVYGVRSTGIYCRPSCPSRRPHPLRVEFFASADAAEQAGYRACRRCRPREVAIDPWIDRVRRACAYLSNANGRASLANVARRVGGSPYHLQRNFKRIVGVTPREFADACRIRKVKQRLRAGMDVTGAAFDAGYGSSSRFYAHALEKLGMRPTTYKKGGKGMSIQYAVVDSPLGKLLVGATDRGVCAVALGETKGALEQRLVAEYPAAAIVEDRGALRQWTEQILAHLQGRTGCLDLPLDIRATAFQWQVWNALAQIPRGTTRTYAEVADTIGRPRAVRAVARACATNPVALAIPCHRVVPARGGVGGYRWGVERKKALLRTERGG